MTIADSWEGLTSPSRGLMIQPRQPPPVTLARDLSRAEQRRLVASNELLVLRRGALGQPADPSWSTSERARWAVLQQVRAFTSLVRADLPFSHQTAALLLGCWVLRPRLPLHVTAPPPPSGAGSERLLVHRHFTTLQEGDLRLHGDLLVTSVERTVVDCARSLPFLEALTIADSALRVGADHDEIRAQLSVLDRSRGVRGARRVCQLATAHVHSPGESIIRGVAVLGGLPEPTTLHPVETDRGPVELDVAWPAVRAAVEFDGAVKLAGLAGEALTRQVNANLAREAALARAGWTVLHLTWADLGDRDALLVRLNRLVRHGAR